MFNHGEEFIMRQLFRKGFLITVGLLAFIGVGMVTPVYAVTAVPNTFMPNTTVTAEELNANFDALERAIDTIGVGIVSGPNNTAVGVGALSSNTTGIYNTVIGISALSSNTTGGGNIAIGIRALSSNTIGFSNAANGSGALFGNTTGAGNTASGNGALSSNTTGSNNTAIGSEANVSVGNLTNATTIGAGAIVDASNKIRFGNDAVTVIEGRVAYTFSPDKTKLERIKPVDGEEVLIKLRTFPQSSWNYIGHDPKTFRHYGPMAQDFYSAFGHDSVGTIGTETTLNLGDVTGILMIAAQQLEKRTSDQKEEIKALHDKNDSQAKQIEALKAETAALKSEVAKRNTRLDALEKIVLGMPK